MDDDRAMDEEAIVHAYDRFASLLRTERFATPDEGWTADLVAAHVAANNELIAEAAEEVAAGGDPAYDNEEKVDDGFLRDYAIRHGGLPGLADAVEDSARRLGRAWTALDEAAAAHPLPVRIVDGGELVRDAPVPMRAFIEGNASFHLRAHQEQLEALIDRGEVPIDLPPPTFDTYQLVMLRRPVTPPELSREATDLLQLQHLGHLKAMRDAGYMLVAGPLLEQDDDRLRGISIYRVASPAQARALAERDPAVRAGWFELEVATWLTRPGHLARPG